MKNLCSSKFAAVRASFAVDRIATPARQKGLGLIALLSLGSLTPLSAHEHPSWHYAQTNLVSDVTGMAAVTDAHLVNPWGLVSSSTSPWWISDNGTGLSTLYNGSGTPLSLVVTVPNVAGVTDPSAPTGVVFNGTPTDFPVAPGAPSRFIFCTEGGTIAGWNSGSMAVQMVDNSSWAVYKGMALANNGGTNYLYAANFKTGKVDVFDHMFTPVTLAASAFNDPWMPKGYAPFNVQAIGGWLYVAYAKTEAGSIDEVHGPGKGFVDVYSTAGVLQHRLEHGSWFNAPWGIALAPANFGPASNMILVGEFGSGKIAMFDAMSGKFRGLLTGEHHRPIRIEGLWALAFGNGAAAGPVNTLYFTAGIDDEAHGLFGTLTAVTDPTDHDGDHDGD